MAKNTTLTKDDLIDTLTEFYNDVLRPEFVSLKKKINGVENSLSQQIREIKNDVKWIKDDIQGVKAELSTKASKKEFNRLKTRVDRYHPSN